MVWRPKLDTKAAANTLREAKVKYVEKKHEEWLKRDNDRFKKDIVDFVAAYILNDFLFFAVSALFMYMRVYGMYVYACVYILS